MEQYQEPLQDSSTGESTQPTEATLAYPPKFVKKEQPANIWVRSMISLALYLVLGYYIFHSFTMLLLITAIVVLHELGHFFAMKFYRYNDLGIFFIPLLGAYVSGTKREVSQKESAVILLAGPLPGVILGIILYLLWQRDPGLSLAGISYYQVSMLLIILNLINLLPVYPLDGGQLLNRVFLDEEGWVSKLFVFLSAALMVWVAWKLEFWVLLVFPLMMLLRLQSDSKFTAVEKKIEEEGINADTSYEDLPDADYWKIRNILVYEHPAFRDIPPSPPYEYHPKEEKIMTTIQSLLHRHLIQDMSLAGKILVLLICLAAFAAPWLINMDMSFFRRFGL
ncbi:MAG TPA: site-2 protease family protein [Chitinophagaceae bacterium]|nr:site-2 protease family protein [Chitinophagaceae bacterium]